MGSRISKDQGAPEPEGRFSQHGALSLDAYEALLEMIMDGTIAPEERLRVETLAEQLGTSQTPVREALPRLEATGLVIRLPRRGYRVAPPLTREDVDLLAEARLLIEPHSAARVCERGDEAVVRALEATIRDMRAAGTGPAYREFRQHLDADARFHAIIAESSGNHFIADATAHLGSHIQRFRLYRGGVTDAPFGIAEHEVVLAAIRAGTPADAHDAMKTHLQNVRARAAADAAALAASPAAS